MSAVADPAAGPRTGREATCGGAMIDDLGWALGVVFRFYAKAASIAFSELPGGPRGYQVLAAAARGEPGNQLKLAQHLGVDRTVMTYLLDKLENAALIERRPDPQDRRARQIVATASGCERLEDLNRRLQAAEDHVLSGLDSEADRLAFRALLRRLATHANALDPVRGGCEIVPDVGGPCAPAGD